MRIAPEIAEALAANGPVVALETTLVAHGFPTGEGLAVGPSREAAVRAAGAIPATIGVLDGEIRVGLTAEELTRFDAATHARPGRATWPPAPCRARSARRPLAARSPSPRGRDPRDGDRRASAASTAAARMSSTSPPTSRALAHSGDRRLGGREVDPRRPGDRGAARDLRRPGARLPHRRAAALLPRRRRPAGIGARRVRRRRRRAIAREHWELGGRGLLLARPPDEKPRDVEPLIEEGLAEASGRASTARR